MKHRLVILIGGLAVFFITPVTAQIVSAPQAQTNSLLTITVGLLNEENSINFIDDPSIASSVYAKTATTTLATTVQALQESLGLPPISPNSFSAHTATANALISVDKNPDNALISFIISQNTSATAFASEPFFARSISFAEGVSGGWLQRESQELNSDPALSLTLNFEDWQLQTSSISSLAYMQDTVSIWQINAEGQLLRHDEIGLFSYQINNQESIFKAFGFPAHSKISDGLMTNIPLALNAENDQLALVIASNHTQLSYEAPPRAVIQVEAAAGYRASDAQSGFYPEVHWDPANKTLKFDPIPIDWLMGGWGASNADLNGDPLLGGFLEIGDFTYITESDGRQYLSGSHLTLFDRLQQPVLTGIAPTLALEDALYAHQGFNGFAPILLIEQNPDSPIQSAWLDNFLSGLSVDSLYLPELFIGFNPIRLEEVPFSAPVSAALSFAGPRPPAIPAPEPGVLWLLCGGLMLLTLRSFWLKADRQGQIHAVIRRIIGETDNPG